MISKPILSSPHNNLYFLVLSFLVTALLFLILPLFIISVAVSKKDALCCARVWRTIATFFDSSKIENTLSNALYFVLLQSIRKEKEETNDPTWCESRFLSVQLGDWEQLADSGSDGLEQAMKKRKKIRRPPHVYQLSSGNVSIAILSFISLLTFGSGLGGQQKKLGRSLLDHDRLCVSTFEIIIRKQKTSKIYRTVWSLSYRISSERDMWPVGLERSYYHEISLRGYYLGVGYFERNTWLLRQNSAPYATKCQWI